jgi:Lactonase, 7-bladed beta-propeller
MVFDSTETYLYSADMWGNKIWTHKKDARKGKLTLVGSLDAPHPGDHPRWVEIHPGGTYLYVLMEAGNNLAIYVIDQQTHMPVFTQLTYPLIPPGVQERLLYLMSAQSLQLTCFAQAWTESSTAPTSSTSHTATTTSSQPPAPIQPTPPATLVPSVSAPLVTSYASCA